MARRTVILMASAGDMIAENACEGCSRPFQKGEPMTAVEANDGEPLGWYCESCLAVWPKFPNAANVFAATPATPTDAAPQEDADE